MEEARYETALAGRRHAAVDPDKRLVARELESRWEAALERERVLRDKVSKLEQQAVARPSVDRERLLNLARDLPAVWNATVTDMRVKQRLVRILVQEVVIDLDDQANEVILTIHWTGGRHTELRLARVRAGRHPKERRPAAADVMKKLGGKWPDRQLAVTLNRMRCQSSAGGSWTVVRVRELRERLGITEFDPAANDSPTISGSDAAHRLSICIGSVHRLIGDGALPAIQLMPSAPWQIPVAALDSESVRIGVRAIAARRPRNFAQLQDLKALRLPGM